MDWLEDGDGHWLLVLDSLDSTSPSSIVHYLPRSLEGCILITTRDKRIGYRLARPENCVDILPMSMDEAMQLLHSHLDPWPQDDSDIGASQELVEALGFLPLAITQAVAFMRQNLVSVREYMTLFRGHKRELLAKDFEDLRQYRGSSNSVLSTFKISLDELAPQAAELLSLMALLDGAGIPKDLIQCPGDDLMDTIIALGTLYAFSLIMTSPSSSDYHMHRLVLYNCPPGIG